MKNDVLNGHSAGSRSFRCGAGAERIPYQKELPDAA